MIEEKGLGNKRINRVGCSLSNHYYQNLKKLAKACNFNHFTTLGNILIEKYLDDIQLVDELQDQYCTQKAYRIVPVKKNGVVFYTLTGRFDL